MAWSLSGNIRGASGLVGPAGASGVPGSSGRILYIHTSPGVLPSSPISHYDVIARCSERGVSALCHFDQSWDLSAWGGSGKVDESGTFWDGNVTRSESEKKFGTASAYFDGSSSALYPGTPNGVTPQGAADFTIEVWVYQTQIVTDFNTLKGPVIFDCGPSNPMVSVESSGQIYFSVNGTDLISGTGIVTNQWQHIALTRTSGTTRLFLDGILQGSVVDTNNYTADYNRPRFGSLYDTWNENTNRRMTGYMDEIRISLGKSWYTSGFTPATSAFDQTWGTTMTLPSPTGKAGLSYRIRNGNGSSPSPIKLYPNNMNDFRASSDTYLASSSIYFDENGLSYWEAGFTPAGILIGATSSMTSQYAPCFVTDGYVWYSLGD